MLNRFLETVAGDTLSFRIVLRGGASPVDVTPMTFSGGVRRKGEAENIVDFSFEQVPSVVGVMRVILSSENTAKLAGQSENYEWYVRMKHDDYIKTLGFGALRVITL